MPIFLWMRMVSVIHFKMGGKLIIICKVVFFQWGFQQLYYEEKVQRVCTLITCYFYTNYLAYCVFVFMCVLNCTLVDIAHDCLWTYVCLYQDKAPSEQILRPFSITFLQQLEQWSNCQRIWGKNDMFSMIFNAINRYWNGYFGH